ncbi:MAG: hypothetical protein K0R82_95 [Flavipsychrobacter sp.]|jgi:hypothetical protein|nr:hypothetical protein [Flavipsychrobacter sp.]
MLKNSKLPLQLLPIFPIKIFSYAIASSNCVYVLSETSILVKVTGNTSRRTPQSIQYFVVLL